MKSYSYASGKFDRTIVVGDIHGCYVEFQELRRLVNYGARRPKDSRSGPDVKKVLDCRFYTVDKSFGQ